MINEEKLFKLIDKNTNTAEIKTVYEFIIKINFISINQIQKEFNYGFNKVNKIIEILEACSLITPKVQGERKIIGTLDDLEKSLSEITNYINALDNEESLNEYKKNKFISNLTPNSLNELKKYNLFDEVYKATYGLIVIDDTDINTLFNNGNIIAYYNDYVNSDCNFELKMVSNDKVSNGLVIIETGATLLTVNKILTNIKNKFPEIKIIYASSERSDEKTHLTFIGTR